MGNKLSLFGLVGATILIGAVSSIAGAASAQEAQPADSVVAQSRREERPRPEVRPLPTIPQAYHRAYYRHDGNFFDNRGIWQSFRLIFGIPNYVENSISQDGRSVDRLYKETLEQQVSSDPVLRTPDLPNPYTGSVLTTPLVITEEPIIPAAPFPSIRRPGYAEPAPDSPQQPAQREQPERASSSTLVTDAIHHNYRHGHTAHHCILCIAVAPWFYVEAEDQEFILLGR